MASAPAVKLSVAQWFAAPQRLNESTVALRHASFLDRAGVIACTTDFTQATV